MTDQELVRRFWEKVDVAGPDDCWNWTASTAGKGYGQIKMPKTRRQLYAHRLSYEIHHGIAPGDMLVMHSCDNPRCVNPAHLSLGTHGDNLQDMARKDRHLYGERNAQAKLTESQIDLVFDLFDRGVAREDIAERVGASKTHIDRILRGEHWRHVYLRRRVLSEHARTT